MYQQRQEKQGLLADTPGIKGLVSELFESRRARFNYVDRGKRGSLKKSSIPLFILNSLASCLGVPILFNLSFHMLTIFTLLKVSILDLLPIMFYGAAISVLLDYIIGFIYDKLPKMGLPILKSIFTFIGTIGLVAGFYFLFKQDGTPEEVVARFRWIILGIAVAYTLSNASAFKNSANLTPSQEDRTHLIYAEYLIKAIFILANVCLPYWIRFWTSNCSCGDTCSASPSDQSCLDCLTTCDTLTNLDIFKYVSVGFAGLAGLANIIVEFAVTPRVDEDIERIPTSINRRINEISQNKLLVKTFYTALIQYVALFGFAFWISFYLDERTTPTENCTKFWGTAAYFCSKSWRKQYSLLLPILTCLIVYLVSLKKNILKFISTEVSLLTIVAGILLIIITANRGLMYFFIVLIGAIFYTTIPTNQIYYTNGIFYDEYLSGSTQPYLPSVLYNLAVKCGFFVAMAFHITLYKAKDLPTDERNSNSDGFGIFLIVAAVIIYTLYSYINSYDIKAFDKIHVATERNLTNTFESVSFYDPVEKTTIRRPVLSHDNFERRFISLMYNLDPRDDMKLIISGKYEKLQSNAVIRIIIFIVFIIASAAVIVVFRDYLEKRWGWFIFAAILMVPISLYALLYNYNVWATAAALGTAKFRSIDKGLVLRFVPMTNKESKLDI